MVGFLENWVRNIVTVAVFIAIIEMLSPSGRIKKVIRLVAGFVLILSVVSPFLGLFGKEADIGKLQFTNSDFINKADIEKEGRLLEEEQIRQIISTYRRNLISRIEECALQVKGVGSAKADIIVNEDYASDDFGSIRRIYLDIAPAGQAGMSGTGDTAGTGGKTGASGKTSTGGKTGTSDAAGETGTTESVASVKKVEIGGLKNGNTGSGISGEGSASSGIILAGRVRSAVAEFMGIDGELVSVRAGNH